MTIPPGAVVMVIPKWLVFAFLVVESVGVAVMSVAMALGKVGLP